MTTGPTVRGLGLADDERIHRIFDQTVQLGASLDNRVAAFDAYRELCLGWYLGPGRADAAVAHDPSGNVVGYALVCVDESAAARWGQRGTLTLVRRVAAEALAGRVDAHSRAFYRARISDAADLMRTRRTPPAQVHAHLNVSRGARTASVARALVAHVDHRCRLAGHDAWYGELNERTETRLGALERIGLEVVDAVPNHTLSRLVGEPVRRLTLVRRLPTIAGSIPGVCSSARR